MKTIRFLVFLVSVLSVTSTCFAVIGPVHVELNCRNPSLGAARANSNNAYKVYLRYNVDIKTHDTIKLWFPTTEAAGTDPLEIVKNACDGLPKINENINNPRFVPNEKFFEKYKNTELEKFKQLYVIRDSSGNTDFVDLPDTSNVPNWGDPCHNDGKYPLMAKDPSGLGCWMMGTVMPPLPVDPIERIKRIREIGNSTSIGYDPCSCHVSTTTNTCKERSLTFFSPLQIEGWRKGYNSIDINTARHTGIISPMTPGRYSVAVATTPEPEPVESEAFVLPCSDITGVRFEPIPITKKPASFSVLFKTGEGGALDNWDSTITLRFPKQFKFTSPILAGKFFVNGVNVTRKNFFLKTADEITEITIGTPVNIENCGDVRVDFDPSLGVGVDYSVSPQIEVATSSEPNFIKSEIYTFPDKPSTRLTKNEELISTDYQIVLPIPEGMSWKAKTNVKIEFPESFTFQKVVTNRTIIVNGIQTMATLNNSDRTISFESSAPISKFMTIYISKDSRIINGIKGKYEINVTIDDKSFGCGEFELSESKLDIDYVQMQHQQAGVDTMMSFMMKPSARNPLKIGDTITVIFPEGTKISADNADKYCAKVDNINSKSVQVDGREMTITLANDVGASSYVLVDILCLVTNPRNRENYILKLRTSRGEECASEPMELEPAPLKSWIYFKDPEGPNCNGWFNKPPILGFDCLNPEARIVFWLNNQPDKEVIYSGEARMMPGTQRATITWQAEFNWVKEYPQTIDFNLDTIAPALTIHSPDKNIVYTNKKKFPIKIERTPIIMTTMGDTSKYQVVDTVYFVYRNFHRLVLEGEIFETGKADNIQRIYEDEIELREGENQVDFEAVDQACNKTNISRTIILDTVPPEFIEVEISLESEYKLGEPIKLKIKTESNCVVYANRDLMSEEATSEPGVSVYASEFTPQNYHENIVFSATDAVGNTTTKSVSLKINPKQKKIGLTLESINWTIDGTWQKPFTNPPTSKNLPKELVGNAYIPIRNLAGVFDVSVEWDQKTKKITLIQKLPGGSKKIVQMWDRQKFALVDGVKTKIDKNGKLYPVIIQGVTMIPLRFVSDVFGAGLVFEAKTGKITLKYPRSVN